MMIYIGNGDFFLGVPARDLTPDEWNALDEETRATVLRLGLYQAAGKRAVGWDEGKAETGKRNRANGASDELRPHESENENRESEN